MEKFLASLARQLWILIMISRQIGNDNQNLALIFTAQKVSVFRVFLVRLFMHSD